MDWLEEEELTLKEKLIGFLSLPLALFIVAFILVIEAIQRRFTSKYVEEKCYRCSWFNKQNKKCKLKSMLAYHVDDICIFKEAGGKSNDS